MGVRPCDPGSGRDGRLDRLQVGVAAGADAGQRMHRAAQIRGLTRGPVRQCRADHPRLQAQRTQRVELIAGERHDALRVGGNLHESGSTPAALWAGRLRGPDRPRGVPSARIVRAAIVSEHSGARDLGGGGDHRCRARDACAGATGRVTTAAAAARKPTLAAAAARAGRIPLSGTGPTSTSRPGEATAASARAAAGQQWSAASSTVCRTCPSWRPLGGRLGQPLFAVALLDVRRTVTAEAPRWENSRLLGRIRPDRYKAT